jgi:murein DD-endopeptidase MepM/ murein hydrolase activator NlpD
MAVICHLEDLELSGLTPPPGPNRKVSNQLKTYSLLGRPPFFRGAHHMEVYVFGVPAQSITYPVGYASPRIARVVGVRSLVLAAVLVAILLPACPVDGVVTSGYGRRIHPLTGRLSQHRGVDVAAPQGTPIMAVLGGVVDAVGRSSTWGHNVVVRSGTLWIRYAHASTVAVRVGDRLGRGDLVGTVGSTGRTTGPHLHLEATRGRRRIDPKFLIAACRE